jgi:hypothetical protein
MACLISLLLILAFNAFAANSTNSLSSAKRTAIIWLIVKLLSGGLPVREK